MKNFVIVGLGQFGLNMLEGLTKRGREVIVIDSDPLVIQQCRDDAAKAIKADVLNRDLFEEVLPDPCDCAIVDLGDEMQSSILVTNYLKRRRLLLISTLEKRTSNCNKLIKLLRHFKPS